MGQLHVPRLARSRRGGPHRSRTALMALAATAIAVLAMAGGGRMPAYGATEGPYGGTPAAVPGTVQAANYDTGGQGTAYNVTSVNGSANSYRSNGVDLEACTDTGCGYDIGWTAAGQWFKYTVNVATAGTYTVSLRLASPYGFTDALHIASSAGTNLSGAIAVPNTGGYQNWTTVTTSVTLPAGQQALTLDQDSNGWNIRQLTFAAAGGGGGAVRHRTAGPPRPCPARCRRPTTTPAARAPPITSPRSTAARTATAPTASTWKRVPTPAAATTSAGRPPDSGSSTRSTSPPPAPMR